MKFMKFHGDHPFSYGVSYGFPMVFLWFSFPRSHGTSPPGPGPPPHSAVQRPAPQPWLEPPARPRSCRGAFRGNPRNAMGFFPANLGGFPDFPYQLTNSNDFTKNGFSQLTNSNDFFEKWRDLRGMSMGFFVR